MEIEYQLLWEGSVGRKSLTDQFEISLQQATLDLTAYADFAPDNMAYDPRKRAYIPKPSFQPQFAREDASGFLMHLEMLHRDYRSREEIWPQSIPEFDFVHETARPISPHVLKTLLKAIKTKQLVQAQYVSLSSDSPKLRKFAPHAIAGDGHRWHMRAYDCENKRYSDFVLSRIASLEILEVLTDEIDEDRVWNTFVCLKLKPDSLLSERQKQKLAYEYSMDDGILHKEVRQAMLFYYLRHFGFDPRDIVDGKMKNKSSYSLQIENLDEVEEWLERRSEKV